MHRLSIFRPPVKVSFRKSGGLQEDLGTAFARNLGRYAPQDSRTTRRGASVKLRAGKVGSAIRSSMARKAITAMSRLG